MNYLINKLFIEKIKLFYHLDTTSANWQCEGFEHGLTSTATCSVFKRLAPLRVPYSNPNDCNAVRVVIPHKLNYFFQKKFLRAQLLQNLSKQLCQDGMIKYKNTAAGKW